MDINGVYTIIVAVIAAIASIVAAYIQSGRRQAAEKERDHFQDQAAGITLPAKIPGADRRNAVMLLGIGGSGKTSLIRALFHDKEANPTEATEDYEIYRHKSQASPLIAARSSDVPAVHLFISDYKGQDLGSLVRAFILQQKMPYSPMAYNYVTAVVFVVDLVAPPTSKGAAVALVSEPSVERVRAQLTQWSDAALDAVFGMITDTLQYGCLFINKLDLLERRTPAEDDKIRRLYRPLADRIAKRCGDAKFEVIVGSACDGTRVPTLQERLLDSSVEDALLVTT